MPAVAPQSAQRKLVLDDSPALVLATVSDARAALPGHDEDDILALIEDGSLPFAWDIALRPGKSAREFRLYPACVEHYRRTGGSRPYPDAARFDAVIVRLLGHHAGKPFLTSNTLRLLLNCGPTHIINLIDAGALKQMPGTVYRRGPNGAALVESYSFVRFLETRLEGAL